MMAAFVFWWSFWGPWQQIYVLKGKLMSLTVEWQKME